MHMCVRMHVPPLHCLQGSDLLMVPIQSKVEIRWAVSGFEYRKQAGVLQRVGLCYVA